MPLLFKRHIFKQLGLSFFVSSLSFLFVFALIKGRKEITKFLNGWNKSETTAKVSPLFYDSLGDFVIDKLMKVGLLLLNML